MPDWSHFRERLKRGDQRYQVLLRIREIEPWLDLPWGRAAVEAQQTYAGFADEQLRPVYQALPIYRVKLLREAGITGTDPELTQQMWWLFAAFRVGRGTAQQKQLALRLANSMQISFWITRTYPSLVQQLTPEGVAAQQRFVDAFSALFPRFSALMKRSHARGPLDENIAELLEIRSEMNKVNETANGDFERKFGADQVARANYWLGQNYALLKKANESEACYLEAANWFEKGGQENQSADCRKRARELKIGFAGDTDQLLSESLRALVSPGETDDSLARALTLTTNADAVSAAGDHFEAIRIAEEIVGELKKLNLLDPQEAGFDAAVDSWIQNLPPRFAGPEFLRAFTDVHRCYLRVLSCRASVRGSDRKRANEAFRLVMSDKADTDELDILSQSSREEKQAYAELAEEWAPFMPPGATPPPPPDPMLAQYDHEQETFTRVSRILELAWADLREESGNRDSAEPQDDLIARAIELEQEAATLKLPFFDAKAKMAHAEVLINAGLPKDAIPLLDEARSLVLGANPTTYGAYAGSNERDIYEMILRDKGMAQAMAGDVQGWSDTCEEGIRSVESQRYLVNSPERQNAFLDWRADFYRFGVAAARKLGDWDKMLERMELIKARSIVRSRLLPNTPDLDAADLSRQFREICDELQATTDQQALPDLRARRRQLWDLMSIARARQRTSAEPPEITVKNLQNVLRVDEAALGYFWQTPDVLLAVVIDQEHFKLERIEFSQSERADYLEFANDMQMLESFNDQMDSIIAELGEKLVPAAVREMIDGKRRLVISPHQTLHIFPFHAARWDSQFFAQRFAIRYAPNLSSLLLPVQGSEENKTLALGISHFQTPPFDSNPLPLAEREAQEVAQIHGSRGAAVESLCGVEASRERFRQLREQNTLPHFRCLHLATHGTSVFDSVTLNHPMESRIILQNGWLDGLEIAELNLRADLVVLSACSSGQRAMKGRGLEEMPGDDIFGLQSALFSSGARSVLGALWPLKDEPAFDLMTRFHTHFAAGSEADEALRLAVTGYLNESPRREIFYWGAFFLSTLGNDSDEPAIFQRGQDVTETGSGAKHCQN